MKILGIDPGLATIGYGVIETEGVRQKVIDFGVITTPAKQPLPARPCRSSSPSSATGARRNSRCS